MKLMSKISKNIKKQRSLNGMTQEELAVKIHVTRQTVSSWETDRTQPDIEILQNLAQIFGIEVEELIYGKRKNTADEKEKQLFGNTLITVLSILGCLLIGVGVVLILSKFWQDFPFMLKLFTCCIPAFLGQGIGIYTYIKKKESLPWCEGASVLWLVGVVTTVSVLLGTVNLNHYIVSDSWMYLFFAVNAIVLMILFKTLSPLAAGYGFSVTWFNVLMNETENLGYINSGDSYGDIAKFILIALGQAAIVAVSFYLSSRLYKKESNIIRYTFASWVNFLGLAVSVCSILLRFTDVVPFASMLIFASVIFFVIGQKHTDYVSPYRLLGLPASAAALCFLAVFFDIGATSGRWVDTAVLVVCLSPFALLVWEKTRPQSVYLRVYTALLTLALLSYNIISVFDDVIRPESFSLEAYDTFKLAEKGFSTVCFFISLAALVMLIVYGAKERKLLYLNMGFVCSCITVIARLYQLDLGLVVTGVLLIVCGAALLFVNLKISRLREKEKLASLNEGEEELQ